MLFFKNFLLLLLLLFTTATLSLAKPRLAWIVEENNGENNEESTREIQNDEGKFMKEVKRRMKEMSSNDCTHMNCPRPLY